MCKKALCLIFAFLLSIESFGAIVSDNDGAAFITKAEFDSLKNNFQSQLDNYNSNIDNKIDNAIATYLAGIKIDVKPINLIDRFEATTGNKQVWLYSLPGFGSSTVNNDIMQSIDCEVVIKKINNLGFAVAKWEGTQGEVSYWWACTTFVGQTHWNDNYGYYDYYACEASARELLLKHRLEGEYTSAQKTDRRKVSLATYGTFPQNTTVLTHNSVGSGSGWLWQNFGNGKNTLKYYCTSLYPQFNVLWMMHYYKYFAATSYDYYLKSTGLTISDIVMTENPTLESVWGATSTVGSKATSRTDTNQRNYAQLSSSLVKTSDGNNYLNVVWGIDATTNIYGNNEDYIPELSSSTTELEVSADVKYQNECWLREGKSTFETSYPNIKQKVKLRNYVMQYLPLYTFCNNTLSNIASTEIVYNGNGSPCYNCPKEDINSRGKIKLTTTGDACICNVKISDKPFNNGNIKTEANEILNINVETGNEVSFELENKGKGNYYIFIKNNTNSNPIIIDFFEVK